MHLHRRKVKKDPILEEASANAHVSPTSSILTETAAAHETKSAAVLQSSLVDSKADGCLEDNSSEQEKRTISGKRPTSKLCIRNMVYVDIHNHAAAVSFIAKCCLGSH